MAKADFSFRANDDLRDIWQHIALDSPGSADRLLLRIFDRIELATSQPKMGSPRPELGPTARLLIEGNYIVIYEPSDDGIFVVAIVHGARSPSEWI